MFGQLDVHRLRVGTIFNPLTHCYTLATNPPVKKVSYVYPQPNRFRSSVVVEGIQGVLCDSFGVCVEIDKPNRQV